MQHPFSDSWLFVSITETHHNFIQGLNKQHPYEGLPPLSPTRHSDVNAHRNRRQSTTPIEDRWVKYGLGPNETSDFIFGRVSRDRASSSNPVSSNLDFILTAGGAPKISAQHFRLFYNEHGAWMFEDISRNGCTVNGHKLISQDQKDESSTALSIISLRPDMYNIIDLPALQLKIQIGRPKPHQAAMNTSMNLSRLDIQTQSQTRSSRSNASNISPAAIPFDYYLLSEDQASDYFSLMSLLDGKCYIGYAYAEIDIAQQTYYNLQSVRDRGRELGILPIVEGTLYNNDFIAITELPDAIPLDDDIAEPAKLSFIFAQMIQKLAFLHNGNIQHGNISAKTIMIRDDHPVWTELVGICLTEQGLEQNLNNDVFNLGNVIASAFMRQGVDWKKSPIAQYLTTCHQVNQKGHVPSIARQLLEDISENGGFSFPFSPNVLVCRVFQIMWVENDEGVVLVRTKDIILVINSVGMPRQTAIAEATTEFANGEYSGRYITYRYAQKLLKQHQVNDYLVEPLGLGPGSFVKTDFRVKKRIWQHTISGMLNISHLLHILPDFTAVCELPQPEQIQEVRGELKTEGYYISARSFSQYVNTIRAYIKIEISDDLDTSVRKRISWFEKRDFEKEVLVSTGWATPQFITLSREDDLQLSAAANFFTSVDECSKWCRESGLEQQAKQLAELRQPLSTEWRILPMVQGGDTVTVSVPSSASSAPKFRFGGRRRRVPNQHRISTYDDLLEYESECESEYESNASTIILPLQKETLHELASWQHENVLSLQGRQSPPVDLITANEEVESQVDNTTKIGESDTIRLSKYQDAEDDHPSAAEIQRRDDSVPSKNVTRGTAFKRIKVDTIQAKGQTPSSMRRRITRRG